MRILPRFATLLLFVGFETLASLAASAQVVRTSAGSVEFLGLESWTPARIEHRLGYTSTEKLHYCAADLKKLGFPEVSVIGYSEHGRRYTVVTVVEPERAAEVAFKPAPAETIALPNDWESLKKSVRDPAFLEGGVLDYGRTLPGALADRDWLADGKPQAWWPAVRTAHTGSDFERAQTVLLNAADPDARALAAVILMNFSSRDAAWTRLASGLRDPAEIVQSTCLQALNSLATFHPHKVDWAPAVSDLVHLLRGTDLFAFQFVLKGLTATQINPDLARPLLGHGGARLVMAYLRAEHPEQHELAHAFLVALAGRDLGNDPAAWSAWVASL